MKAMINYMMIVTSRGVNVNDRGVVMLILCCPSGNLL